MDQEDLGEERCSRPILEWEHVKIISWQWRWPDRGHRKKGFRWSGLHLNPTRRIERILKEWSLKDHKVSKLDDLGSKNKAKLAIMEYVQMSSINLDWTPWNKKGVDHLRRSIYQRKIKLSIVPSMCGTILGKT